MIFRVLLENVSNVQEASTGTIDVKRLADHLRLRIDRDEHTTWSTRQWKYEVGVIW